MSESPDKKIRAKQPKTGNVRPQQEPRLSYQINFLGGQ